MTNETPLQKIHFDPSFEVARGFDTVKKNARVAAALAGRPGFEFVSPRPVDRSQLLAVHDETYVHAVISGSPLHLARSAGVDWSPDHVASWLGSTGGVLAAASVVLNGDRVAGSLSSGLHHARYESGSGYCTFNGLALAAHEAIMAGATGVLIIDFDAHGGGGTAAIIERLHQRGIRGIRQIDVSTSSFDSYDSNERSTHVLSGPETYLDDIAQALESVDDSARFDLVLYNAGMDPHEKAGGPHGIDTATIAERERMVFDWCADRGYGVAWVLAGGYASNDFGLDEVAELHALTAEAAARINRRSTN